jgi:uncharacterized Zn finger protein
VSDFEYTKPLPVDGGVKAKNRRGSIGSKWWSRRFVDTLEAIADKGRLTRGRAYARAGQVIKFSVAAYEVSASVQGSRVMPYKVAIGINAIPEDVWTEIEQALASQAVFRAMLLAGEMPPEIEDVFVAFEVPLFPTDTDDLHFSCSCPDYGWPCKHVAAALYVLAEAFDEDPFLVLAWNGRTREQLLAALRAYVPDEGAEPSPLLVDDVPLADRMDAYWAPSTSLARLAERAAEPEAPADLLLRVLEPPSVKVRGRTLTDILRPVYRSLVDRPPVDPAEE